jgi:restriction endonuclease Mrr
VLRYLAAHPDGVSAKDAHEAAADVLCVSDEDRQELLPSGAQLIYKNRAGWAHDQGRLKVRHKAAGAAMLVPVLSGLLPSVGRPRRHC